MDIKKKVDCGPKTFDRTIKTYSRVSGTANKVRSNVQKGMKAKKEAENQLQKSGENEGAFASNKTMQAAKEARKRAIKAPYKALKNEMARRRRNTMRGGEWESPTSALRLNEAKTSTRTNTSPGVKTRLHVTDGRAVKTLHAKRQNAFRRSTVKNYIKRTQRAAQTAKKGFEAVINGAMAFVRVSKSLFLLIGAAGGQVVFILCIAALIAAILSPFAFLFGGNNSIDDYPSLAEVANDINDEYTAKFNTIIADHDEVDEVQIKDYEIDSAQYVASNWKDILSVWSVNNDIYRGEKKTDDELEEIDPQKPVEQDDLPYVMTDQNVGSLTNMFWQMNDITYEIKTEEVEVDPNAPPTPSSTSSKVTPQGPYIPDPTPMPEPTPETETIKTLIITPVSKDYMWGADNYNFDDEQREWLDELMSDKYQKEWSLLLLGIVGTEITEVQKDLLAHLKGPGAIIAYNASTRLGHPYSKQKRGQGLYVDCSYFARWCYLEADFKWFTAATAAEQARWCDKNGCVVERKKLQAGDLLFYSFAKNGRYKNISHVAVYIGRASDGKEYMIDASSSNGFVIFREVFTDKSLVMCGRPLMYLDKD